MRRNNSVYERVKALKEAAEGEAYRGLLTEFYAAERGRWSSAAALRPDLPRAKPRPRSRLPTGRNHHAAAEENTAVRKQIRAQFDQVLMDEFQDTNGLQAKLLKLVRPPDRFSPWATSASPYTASVTPSRTCSATIVRGEAWRQAAGRADRKLAQPRRYSAVTTIPGRRGWHRGARIGAQFAEKRIRRSVLAAMGEDAETRCRSKPNGWREGF
jgi:hypothetical protein